MVYLGSFYIHFDIFYTLFTPDKSKTPLNQPTK